MYVVSSMGVTGVRTEFSSNLTETIDTIRKHTKIPCAIGFGISTPEQAAKMAGISDGAIVGSAIIRVIAQYKDQAKEPLKEFVASLKNALLIV